MGHPFSVNHALNFCFPTSLLSNKVFFSSFWVRNKLVIIVWNSSLPEWVTVTVWAPHLIGSKKQRRNCFLTIFYKMGGIAEVEHGYSVFIYLPCFFRYPYINRTVTNKGCDVEECVCVVAASGLQLYITRDGTAELGTRQRQQQLARRDYQRVVLHPHDNRYEPYLNHPDAPIAGPRSPSGSGLRHTFPHWPS